MTICRIFPMTLNGIRNRNDSLAGDRLDLSAFLEPPLTRRKLELPRNGAARIALIRANDGD